MTWLPSMIEVTTFNDTTRRYIDVHGAACPGPTFPRVVDCAYCKSAVTCPGNCKGCGAPARLAVEAKR